MKKLLAILLALAMVMSLAACGAEPADDDKDDKNEIVETTEEATEEITEEVTEEENEPSNSKVTSSSELVHGSVSGTVYKNTSLNIEIEFPSSWGFYSDTELAAMLSMTGNLDTVAMMEAYEQFGMYYEMFAYDPATGENVQIIIQDMSRFGGYSILEDDVIDGIITGVRGNATVTNVSEYEDAMLGGEAYRKVTLEANTNGVSFEQTYYVSVAGDYIVCIAATVYDTEMSEIEAYFK